MNTVAIVEYPEILHGSGSLQIETHSSMETLAPLMPAIMELKKTAYGRQLEVENDILRPGSFGREYDTPDRVEGLTLQALSTFAAGGVYHLIRSLEDPSKLSGLLRIVPASGHSEDYPVVAGDCTIGDILTDPPRTGFGSALLHHGLRTFPPDYGRLAQLNAIAGSSVNNWYEDLGFEAGYPVPSWVVDRQEIGMVRFFTPEHIGVRGVLRELESRRPGLKTSHTISQ